jgi:16S rRNA (uracil1498-N3)-methyltransferase
MKERAARLFVDAGLAAGSTMTLDAGPSHHVVRVLRLRPGDPLTLFDGRGGEHEARIAALEGRKVVVEVGAHRAIERESPLAVTLVQGLSSGERMDFTVQKAVELGVAAIQPVAAEKSVVRLSGERAEARRAHWQRVAIAACEQCGRNRIPEIRPVIALDRLATSAKALKLLLAPDANRSLKTALQAGRRDIVLAAGPEAGFSEPEVGRLLAGGFLAVSLGPRILRTETAALAALAALNARAGDF